MKLAHNNKSNDGNCNSHKKYYYTNYNLILQKIIRKTVKFIMLLVSSKANNWLNELSLSDRKESQLR